MPCLAAGAFEARITDAEGAPVADAVLSLHALDFTPPAVADTPRASMDQRNRRFDPYVLPVRLGTLVKFPNSDDIRHSVYSFSAPKRFKLPLYKDTPSAPIIFDQPGVVVLGCNIHDWMLGYIYVADTPYFGKADAQGKVDIEGLPAGRYEVTLWHPQARSRTPQVMETAPVDVSALARVYSLEMRSAPQNSQPTSSVPSVEDKFKRWRQ